MKQIIFLDTGMEADRDEIDTRIKNGWIPFHASYDAEDGLWDLVLFLPAGTNDLHDYGDGV